jgi:hypothetical protein
MDGEVAVRLVTFKADADSPAPTTTVGGCFEMGGADSLAATQTQQRQPSMVNWR